MENDVQQLVDLLYDMIDNAKSVPLSSDRCVIERNRALDFLDEIRAQLPTELEEAKKLMSARNEYVVNAKKEAAALRERAQKEAAALRERAQKEAKHIISESETLFTARQQAGDMLHKAEERSREMYRIVNEYTEDALKRTEEALQSALEEVRNSHRQYTDLSRMRMKEVIQTVKSTIPEPEPVPDDEQDS